jgi:hypothetical protein
MLERIASAPMPMAAKRSCRIPMPYASSVLISELSADEEKTIRTPSPTRRSAGRRIH